MAKFTRTKKFMKGSLISYEIGDPRVPNILGNWGPGSPISYENGDPGSPFWESPFSLDTGTCRLPKKPAKKSYDELVALVKSHYTPKPSVIVQRFQFHSRTQKPGETVATFVAELRQLPYSGKFSLGTNFRDFRGQTCFRENKRFS